MAALIDHIIGHSKQIDHLFAAASQQTLGNSLIFTGPDGIGKRRVALALAQMLICPSSQPPCGTCPHCIRVAQRQSENLFIVEPDDKASIKIEKSREILHYLSLQLIGRARVVIIDHAELMTEQAANALLKIFEEPPVNTYFILITPSVKSLLSTIRSRAQIIAFSPLSETDIRSHGSAPEWAIKACAGSFSRLLALTDEDFRESRKIAGQMLFQLITDHDFFYKQDWRDYIKRRDMAIEVAHHWLTLFRDAEVLRAGGQNIINVDQEELIRALLALPLMKFSHMSKAIVSLEDSLRHNYDPQLVFDALWVGGQKHV